MAIRNPPRVTLATGRRNQRGGGLYGEGPVPAPSRVVASGASAYIAHAVGQTRRLYAGSVAVAGTDTAMTMVGCGAMVGAGTAGAPVSNGSPNYAAISTFGTGVNYSLRSPSLTNMSRLPRVQLAIHEASTSQYATLNAWHGMSSAAMHALAVQAAAQASAIVLAAFARSGISGNYFLMTGDGTYVSGVDTGVARAYGNDIVFLVDASVSGTVTGSLYVNGALAWSGSKTSNVSSGTTALAAEFSFKTTGAFSIDADLWEHWVMDTK